MKLEIKIKERTTGFPKQVNKDLGEVYFVNPEWGSDGNSGLTAKEAFKTLERAVFCVDGNRAIININYDENF